MCVWKSAKVVLKAVVEDQFDLSTPSVKDGIEAEEVGQLLGNLGLKI